MLGHDMVPDSDGAFAFTSSCREAVRADEVSGRRLRPPRASCGETPGYACNPH